MLYALRCNNICIYTVAFGQSEVKESYINCLLTHSVGVVWTHSVGVVWRRD